MIEDGRSKRMVEEDGRSKLGSLGNLTSPKLEEHKQRVATLCFCSTIVLLCRSVLDLSSDRNVGS